MGKLRSPALPLFQTYDFICQACGYIDKAYERTIRLLDHGRNVHCASFDLKSAYIIGSQRSVTLSELAHVSSLEIK